MAVATGRVFTSPPRAAGGTDGISEVAPGSSGGLSRHSCFLLKYFQFGRSLVLLESLPWLHLGSRFGLEGRWSVLPCPSKDSNTSTGRGPLNHEAVPFYPLVNVCAGAAWTSHRRDPTVVPTQLFPASGWRESPCSEYLWEGSSAT